MIYFIGAESGIVDSLTVKSKNIIEEADVIICSIPDMNKELLVYANGGCEIVNSASMTLEQIVVTMVASAQTGKLVAQIVLGDASEFNEENEQLDFQRCYGLEYEVVPSVG